MASNNSRPDSVSSDAAVAAKGSQSDSRNSDIDSDDDYDEPVEEEEEEDTDDPSDDESDYSADNDGTEKPLSGPDSYRKDASGRGDEEEEVDDNTPETNVRRFMEALEGRRVKLREEKEDHDYVFYEDLFNFPKDQERWTEEDLQEFWGEAPLKSTKPGWDPVLADKEDWQIVNEEIQAGRDPPIAPFYVPYYKNYPAIPDNHHDIANPKSVIEELDRVEEFLTWVSYIFPDGSSYEGTVWDDLANGKGVYVAEQGLVRYEGEWLQNLMDGHGVVEVEIPDIQPRPGSKLEAKMRAEGKIIKRDFMSPEDQKWLDMDIEDSVRFTTGHSEVPFYENDTWIQVFGEKPEKGRYKYAGQWKHGRMHGCGVYEVNEHIIYGRFYFGEYLDESSGCDADISGLHAGIAEVAAAKARMFVNKPDGMVREERGPYGDPQHPYFYEEEDVWMAPGFVNQFYETPDYWKTYLEEVDKEREMWLNSFYKAPLRIPMPAELEYWWETDESPEFVLINKEPVPDPEDPSRFVYSEDPLILHTRTGRLINYVEDEKYGVRLFWQPPLKEGENVNPDNVEFLPLGFDEFYGRAKPAVKKENWLTRLVTSFESAIKPKLAQLEDWLADKKKASELNLKLIEHEIDLVEAEICLEEEIEDFESELKRKQKEEEKRASEMDLLDESSVSSVRGVDSDEEDEDEGEDTPSSFGIASTKNSEKVSKEDKKGRQPGNSPFSSLSLSFGTFASATQVPKKILDSFLSRNRNNQPPVARRTSYTDIFKVDHTESASSISYPRKIDQSVRLRIARNRGFKPYMTDKNNIGHTVLAAGTVFRRSKDVNPFRNKSLHANCGIQGGLNLEKDPLCVLSWHVPVGPPQKCDILNMST